MFNNQSKGKAANVQRSHINGPMHNSFTTVLTTDSSGAVQLGERQPGYDVNDALDVVQTQNDDPSRNTVPSDPNHLAATSDDVSIVELLESASGYNLEVEETMQEVAALEVALLAEDMEEATTTTLSSGTAMGDKNSQDNMDFLDTDLEQSMSSSSSLFSQGDYCDDACEFPDVDEEKQSVGETDDHFNAAVLPSTSQDTECDFSQNDDEGVGFTEVGGVLPSCVADCEFCTAMRSAAEITEQQTGDSEQLKTFSSSAVRAPADVCTCFYCAADGRSVHRGFASLGCSCKSCGAVVNTNNKRMRTRQPVRITLNTQLPPSRSCDRIGVGMCQRSACRIRVGGPFGAEFNAVPTGQSVHTFTEENSASCRIFEGQGFHVEILRGSFPTHDYHVWSFSDVYDFDARCLGQLGPSSCGVSAVAYTLRAFDVEFRLPELQNVIRLRHRANGSPFPRYILSRSCAGTTHSDLIAAVEHLSAGRIRGRFFAMYPRRELPLAAWLLFWIKSGAIPLLTMNLQRDVTKQALADAWHHQVAFGGGATGIYLTNPLEAVHETTLAELLCSPSVLLVRAADVRERAMWTQSMRMQELLQQDDARWLTMNVIGQAVHVMRQGGSQSSDPQLTHIAIPAEYKSGVTLYAREGSHCWDLIQQAPELPHMQHNHVPC